MNILFALQSLLADINDVAITESVCGYLLQRPHGALTDEQVLIANDDEAVELGVYVAPQVIKRLQAANPMEQLSSSNLADFCTAAEGVSHFQYLVWCIQHGRTASLLELELQAEVDKYAAAMWLSISQGKQHYSCELHSRMFSSVSYAPGLDDQTLSRYREANRCAAYYCQHLDRRHLASRQPSVSTWIRELRQFYRLGHHAKISRSLSGSC